MSKTPPAPPSNFQIENWFTYHKPGPGDADRYERIRDAGKELAYAIVANTPPGEDQDAAIRAVRQAVMWANAGVACKGQ